MITRRVVLGASAAVVVPCAASASIVTYKEWRFLTEKGREKLPDDLLRSLEAQVDLVESLRIKPAIKAWFRKVPLEVDPTRSGSPGVYQPGRKRILFTVETQPSDNPVLLHELLHAYHNEVLRSGMQNPTIIKFYKAAKASGAFAPDLYMLKNQGEFLAMCASVVIWGRASRPPGTRANVHNKLPEFYDWIVKEFGFTET